jgi:hypothetical protein
MFCPDIGVLQRIRFRDSAPKQLLHRVSQRDFRFCRERLTLTERGLDLGAGALIRQGCRSKQVVRKPGVPFPKEPETHVLNADRVPTYLVGRKPRIEQHSAGALREPLEHGTLYLSAQRDDRIHASGAPGRRPGAERRGGQQQQPHAKRDLGAKRQQPEGVCAQPARQGRRGRHPDDAPECDGRTAIRSTSLAIDSGLAPRTMRMPTSRVRAATVAAATP